MATIIPTHTVTNALRAAADLYKADAAELTRTGQGGLSIAFRQQAAEALRLADLIEEGDTLTLT